MTDRPRTDSLAGRRTPTTADAARAAEATLRIPAMDCADCARRIRARLETLEGVESISTEPLSRRLRVRYAPARLEPSKLRRELGHMGFTTEEDAPGAEVVAGAGTWTSTEALRTYVSGAIFLIAVLLSLPRDGGAALHLAVGERAVPLFGLAFIVAALIGGWNFFPKALRAVRNRSLDMNFLMTIAILGAVGIGEYLEAAAIASLFSLAELLEDFSVDRARRSVESLMKLAPTTAVVVRDGAEVTVAAADVSIGEEVVVRPGERVPVDGTVVEGSSAVDESSVTGESVPKDKTAGSPVFAGTINASGFLRIRVDRKAGDTTLDRMIQLVSEAEGQRTRSEQFVDRFARWYTPLVTVAAVAVVGVPVLFGAPFGEWFVRGLTLLVIACPCALVISTPVAVVSGVTAAARNGVLIKGGIHLETMGEVRVVALDKTGTLTKGAPELVDVVPAPGGGVGENELLALAAAVEARSEHPLARAIVRAAEERGADMALKRVADFESIPGLGVRGVLDGRPYVAGKLELFRESGEVTSDFARLQREGKTVIAVGPPERPHGLLALADRPREGAAEALAALRRAGVVRIVLLTGDNRETAEAIADELGIDEVHAGLLPQDKVRILKALEAEHGRVAMVGDGVNDAPALAAASVGIAMGVAGSDTAIETADVALMGDDLSKLAYLVRLSRRGRKVIRQNIATSIALKGGLALGVPLGLVSLIGAVLVGDVGASLGVTGNSLRLARVGSTDT